MTRNVSIVFLMVLVSCRYGRDGLPKNICGINVMAVWSDPVSVKSNLGRAFAPTRTLGLARAKDTLMAYVYNDSGFVQTVYTGATVLLEGGDPSKVAFSLGVNTEHIWPQSKGSSEEPMRSDLFILAPSMEAANSARGNKPYGDVSQHQDARRLSAPGGTGVSYTTATAFEPRSDIKGDVARSTLYFATIYPNAADLEFLAAQIEYLLEWNRADPPSPTEIERMYRIGQIQGNCNPFVAQPDLAELTFVRPR